MTTTSNGSSTGFRESQTALVAIIDRLGLELQVASAARRQPDEIRCTGESEGSRELVMSLWSGQ